MKLRNKKTGRIIDSNELLTQEFILDLFSKDFNYFCSKLNKICEEWEDYEEPEKFWSINGDATIEHFDRLNENDHCKQIGNYFETKEEAEKAVRKLKAWKRLKDKGFKFVGRSLKDLTITYSFDNYDEPDIPQMNKDLDLLFSGGEE